MVNIKTDSQLRDFYSKYIYPGNNKHDSFFKMGVLPHIKDYPIARMLELGCGSGAVLEEIVDSLPSSEIVALDRSQAAIHSLQTNYLLAKNVNIVKRDFISDDVSDLGKFQFIHCQGVLHHMADTSIALKNINKLLDENGLVYLWVYNQAGRKEIIHFKNLAENCAFDDIEVAASKILNLKRSIGYTTKHKKYLARSDQASFYSKMINLLIMIERYGHRYTFKKYFKNVVGRIFFKEKEKKQFTIGLADEYYNPQEIFFTTKDFIETVESHGFRKVKIVDGISDSIMELARCDQDLRRFIEQYAEKFYDIADFVEQPRGIGILFKKQ